MKRMSIAGAPAIRSGRSSGSWRSWTVAIAAVLVGLSTPAARDASAASPCDSATHPSQCAWLDAGALPPFVRDAIVVKGGALGGGNVLVLTSGDPLDPDAEISNDLGQLGCGTNPDGWETFDCVLMDAFVPPDGKIKDKGCGDAKGDRTYGADETTDVIVKP